MAEGTLGRRSLSRGGGQVVSVPVCFYNTLSKGMCVVEGDGRVRVSKSLVINLDSIQAGRVFEA